MNRPTGVTILAILQFIGAIFTILGSLFALIGGGIVTTLGIGGSSPEAAAAGGVIMFFSVFMLVLGIISIVLAIGLWQMKEWAWIATLVLQGITIAIQILQLVLGKAPNFLSLAFAVVIVIYLMRPEVKQAFCR